MRTECIYQLVNGNLRTSVWGKRQVLDFTNQILDWIAQLGERLPYKQEVAGSNPARVMAKRLHELIIHSYFKA